MAPKGYCTAADVAAQMQVTFTSPQSTLCTTLIEQAEVAIDHYCNRGWLMGEQTLESFRYPGATVCLKYFPVDTITAVKGRCGGMGGTEEDLVEGTDYEVEDAAAGIIRLGISYFERVRVTYTPDNTVPLDLKRAITELVAAWMQPALATTTTGGMTGIESFTLPDLTVKFSKGAQVGEGRVWPPSVMALLDSFRMPAIG